MREQDVVATELMGDVWPATQPGEDPVLYGHVELTPRGAFEARSVQTFSLTYTVGRYGIDDTGSIRVVFRFMGDWGDLQTTNPRDYNYVTASSSTDSRISLQYAKTGHQRPWFRCLTARLHGGYLKEGDKITIVFGDSSQGSPGMKMQSFCEAGFEFKVLADVCAVGQAEDHWGNPTPLAEGRFKLESSIVVNGLPSEVHYKTGDKSVSFEGLSVDEPGVVWIKVLDESGKCVAQAGPLHIRDGLSGSWGDLHGQSGESIGITTSRNYFDFARNKSFLDVSGHQANDFQVNNAFWKYLNELTAEYHEDGRFVVFPGYEWSGNTAVGGDRNVFFRTEGRQIRRSSHALITDRSDINTDASTAAALFEALQEEDCVVYAHVGGRYADTKQAHDGKLETAMEIHSAWGTFEWLLTDGFKLGHRCGVVCNSDGHKGRPGASYPGVATFGAYGGLTCFLTDDFSRDGLFECMRRRHHYGTTGCRMHMQVEADLSQPSTLFHRDPNCYDNPDKETVTRVMMGDIVRSEAGSVKLDIHVNAHAPVEKIEVRNGEEVVKTLRPYAPATEKNSARIRVLWSGAEYRGRGRQTNWTGRARFAGCNITAMQKINAWNHERKLAQNGSDTIEWDAMTTGNYGGFDVWLDVNSSDAAVDLTCNYGVLQTDTISLDAEGVQLDAGGLKRQVNVYRLPETLSQTEIKESVEVPLHKRGDNPLWICVYTEDGFQAWSSPIFIFE